MLQLHSTEDVAASAIGLIWVCCAGAGGPEPQHNGEICGAHLGPAEDR